jgi:hypothetical protein
VAGTAAGADAGGDGPAKSEIATGCQGVEVRGVRGLQLGPAEGVHW